MKSLEFIGQSGEWSIYEVNDCLDYHNQEGKEYFLDKGDTIKPGSEKYQAFLALNSVNVKNIDEMHTAIRMYDFLNDAPIFFFKFTNNGQSYLVTRYKLPLK